MMLTSPKSQKSDDELEAEESLLADQVDQWSIPGSSLCEDFSVEDPGDDNISLLSSHGVDSEDVSVFGWTPSSRRHSDASSHGSSGLFLSEDGSNKMDDSGNFLDSFYGWMGFAQASVSETETETGGTHD